MEQRQLITLDTHTLIWWLADKKELSNKARRLIDKQSKQSNSLCVSSISIWEISMLVARKRLTLNMQLEDWIAGVEQVEPIQFVPVTNRIALRSNQLPEPIHQDPADRMIIATAKELDCPLVTADARIRDYGFIETIW